MKDCDAFIDDADLAAWAVAVLRSLFRCWQDQPGWDGESARPSDTKLAFTLLRLLRSIMPTSAPPPQIVPLSDGGFQAEWHSNGESLEIEVGAEGYPSYYYFNRLTGEEDDSSLADNIDRVRILVARFS